MNNRKTILVFILVFFCLPGFSQVSSVNHDFKKFIDCRINKNIDFSKVDENFEEYKMFADKEIVILTREDNGKFRMERGILQLSEMGGKKFLNFHYGNYWGHPYFWTKDTYTYFTQCYDSIMAK